MLEQIGCIGIYGVGLLGGSIGLAVKSLNASLKIVGIGRSPERLTHARELGAIDSFICDPTQEPATVDLLVVCTPVRMLAGHIQHALPMMKQGGIVTDVGSAKGSVVADCEAACEDRAHFIGSHPMAGSHKTGVDAATAALFNNRVCVLTPTSNTNETHLRFIDAFWKQLGMNTVFMSPERHDAVTARISHLPHLAASALCKLAERLGPDGSSILGSGFHDTTRIAAGDPSLWLDIVMENREEISNAMKEMISQFEMLIEKLDQNDETAVNEFLLQTQKWKLNHSPSDG